VPIVDAPPATVVERREREASQPKTNVTRTDPDPIDAVPQTAVTDPDSRPMRHPITDSPPTEHEADAPVLSKPGLLDSLTSNQRLGLGIGLGAALVLLLAIAAAAMGLFTHREVERVQLPAPTQPR